jgi:transcriptional regulator with XRE-family HTH domain
MRCRRRDGSRKADSVADSSCGEEVHVGPALRAQRVKHNLSIRALAEKSGLATNTLSLIENDRTSPCIATLRQLALALEIPITAFFENDEPRRRIAYAKAGDRCKRAFIQGQLENLGEGLGHCAVKPFIVTMNPNAGSGAQPIVHTGYEFAHCLTGRLLYTVADQTYVLEPGDSLLFESHLPHCWQNVEAVPARMILILCPTDPHDRPAQRHSIPDAPGKA